jgi:RimJ/RimL family protein N-acetyltransferase
MQYNKTITLKDGRACLLRHGVKADGQAELDIFRLCHEQTDNLLTYPDEITFTAEEEGEFLQKKADSDNEIEILAVLDGKVVGTAGIEQLSPKAKLRHRCDFGISVDQAYWGLGIGRALTEACIECAKEAGYEQIELEVVAENERAVEMYRRAGYIEYGRNPRSFKSRLTGDYQEIVHMRMELT